MKGYPYSIDVADGRQVLDERVLGFVFPEVEQDDEQKCCTRSEIEGGGALCGLGRRRGYRQQINNGLEDFGILQDVFDQCVLVDVVHSSGYYCVLLDVNYVEGMIDWELPITSNNAMAADFNAGDVSLASNICRIDSIRSLQRMSIENSNYRCTLCLPERVHRLCRYHKRC